MRPSLGVGPVTFLKMMSSGFEGFMEQMEKLSLTSSKVAMLMRKVKDIQSVADDPNLSVYEKCHEIAKKSGIIDFYRRKYGDDSYRIDTIQKFLDSPMIIGSDSWDEALSHVEKYLSDDSKDRLIFSTIHGVKGLECDHVFVVSLSLGNLPSKRGLKICKSQQQIDEYTEEERRLLYVACTRAKQTLNFFTDTPEVSPFIHDMEGTFDHGVMKTAPVNVSEEEDGVIEDGNFALEEV